MKSILENLLVSNHHFKKDEQMLKYRFELLNSLLLSGSIFLLLIGLVRLSEVNTIKLGVLEIALSIIFTILIFSLRKKKESFETISTSILVILFIGFCIISIVLGDDSSKMHWHGILIVIVFMLKGLKAGLNTFLLTVITYLAFFFLPSIELSLTLKELVITLVSYGVLSIFLTFSELKHEKNRKSIDEKNRELFLEIRRDPLSKLPNLLTLKEDLQSHGKNVSLLYLHMDNFDTLTYAFGSKFSDKIMINASNLLKSFENKKIKLYQVEAHRFAFILSKAYKDEDIQLAKYICTVFEQVNIDYENTSIPVSISVGIAKGDNEKILFQAKIALKEALEKGDSNYKLFKFDKSRQEKQNNDIYWLQNIKETIKKDQLVVYYQPIFDNKTGKISKYEALVRALDRGKVISPFFFLDAAKSTGLLDCITRSVIEKSFNKFKNESYEFSINITQKDLNSDYFIDYLIQKKDKYNINPNRVILEILENISSLESKQMLDKLHKLKDLGFQIAIDDFGAEASNFSRLLSIDANIIKIDAQFIKNIHTNPNSYKIVEAIVSLSKNLGAKTVAEFVHNKEVYEIVKKLGVDYSQGFYLGEPLPHIKTKDKLELETV